MSQPDSYAIEVPLRAHRLLSDLWKCVDGKPYKEFGGPLGTTFVIAMAGPMINFPFERLERDDPAKSERHLHGKSMQTFHAMIDDTKLGETPFFGAGAWRYTYVKAARPSLVSVEPEILDALAEDGATKAAETISTKVWFAAMRNALAHSAVVYLDTDGRQAAGAPTEAIAFVSDDRGWMGRKSVLLGSHIFRIEQAAFREFLDQWARWLERE